MILAVSDTIAIAGMAVGAVLGFLIHFVITLLSKGKAKASAQEILSEAKIDAEKVRGDAEAQARDRAEELKAQAEKQIETDREDLNEKGRRLDKREDQIERKQGLLDDKQESILRSENEISARRKRMQVQEENLEKVYKQEVDELEKISGLNKQEAGRMLLEKLEKTLDGEMSELIEKRMRAAREESEEKSREIVVTTIQRLAAKHTSENVSSSIQLPSEDMKGRIIGREGRNIRAFEKATGVDVVVDETPGVVIVSGFDPVRREIARRSMAELVTDGRIHPARIEEIVEANQSEMDKVIAEAGKEGCSVLGLHEVHPEIQKLLGRLQFRTSYGQNMLDHSIEVARLMQLLACQVGLDETIAKKSGLMHDMGKAIDHEVEGGHPEIGAEFAKRYGEQDLVVNAIAAHHDGCEKLSLFPVLVQAADAISAARPGARRESLERYIKRLEELEEVAKSFEGVEHVYAIQAGREVRIMVNSDAVDDSRMPVLGRDIANKIEEELRYPGEIKVTLMRETRVVEFAR
ncbi:MAG: ribonuclease Y [Planctomycetota bacterium]|nr:ribonuclease Y [Planctomycetota bacterium]